LGANPHERRRTQASKAPGGAVPSPVQFPDKKNSYIIMKFQT
jgi:hypothetical protein